MANTGALSFSSIVGSDLDNTTTTVHWSNPSNALAYDSSYAFISVIASSTFADYLVATNLSSPVPNGATIDGIVAEIETAGFASASIGIDAVYIIKGGAKTGANKGTFTSFGTGRQYYSYGGASDLWSATLSSSDVNASNFGVCFRFIKYSGKSVPTVTVDHVRMTIYYTDGTIKGTTGIGSMTGVSTITL